MVKKVHFAENSKFSSSKQWCLNVILTPEETKINVFSKGIKKGLIGSIPHLGQIFPISRVGLRELWKNVQKNDEKNITSDKINRIKPILSERIVFEVWLPWKVLSRIISRVQQKHTNKKTIKLIIRIL